MTAPAIDLPAGWRAEATTLLFADVVESVRLIAQDEAHQAPRLGRLLDALVVLAQTQFGARLMERRGDGLLFQWTGHERRAAACGLALQARCARLNRAFQGEAEAILMRVGLHSGEVLSDGAHFYGTQINLAARVAELAGPGQVLVSQAVRDRLVPGIDGEITDLGDCWVKHAAEPIRAFRLTEVAVPGQGRGTPEDLAAQLPAAEVPVPCIAVLPFRTLAFADDEERAAAKELIGENIVHALSRTDQLAVVSWYSTRLLRDDGVDLPALALRLGAGWVVSGSCSSFRGRLTVGLELLDASSNTVTWTARLSTELGDLMSAEPQAVSELAQGIVQRVCEAEAKRLSRHALPNLASHSILTGAIGLMHRSARDSFMKSREALEYLLERHPRMHAVRPWLAQWYVLKNTRGFGDEPQADAARAIEQARRALDALPDDGRALALLGFAHYHLLRDVVQAERHLDLARGANPNDPLALIFSAAIKASLGKPLEGLDLSAGALRIAPFDPLRDYMRGIASGCALSAGDLDLAIQLAEQSVRENSGHPYPWRVLLIASANKGDAPTAQRALQQLGRLGQRLTIAGYRAQSKLPDDQLALAERALRSVGVPER